MSTVVLALAGVLSGCADQEADGGPLDVEIVASESYCLTPHAGPKTATVVLRNRAPEATEATVELTVGSETLARDVTVSAEGGATVRLTIPSTDPCVARVVVDGRAGPDVRLAQAIE